MELIINDKAYEFKFGIGFVKQLDEKYSLTQNGLTFGIGLETLIPNLLTGSVIALSECLYLANKTESPRVSASALDSYIEDENTDIEELFDKVVDELKKSNATKLKARTLLDQLNQPQA